MKKNRTFIISLILILVMAIGNVTYAAQVDVASPVEEAEERRYEILDTLTYGIGFNGNQINCFATMASEYAQKYVISGMLQIKNSNGYYDYVYTWSEETYTGQSCTWDKYCNSAGNGEYLLTLHINIFDGSKWENLTFTKAKTR